MNSPGESTQRARVVWVGLNLPSPNGPCLWRLHPGPLLTWLPVPECSACLSATPPSFPFFSLLPVMLSWCQGQTLGLRRQSWPLGGLSCRTWHKSSSGEQYSRGQVLPCADCGIALASLSSPARILSEQVTLGAKAPGTCPSQAVG